MTQVPDLLTMLKSGVHFGHQVSKRHPKMAPYIVTTKSGFHIINLEQTQEMLKEALGYVTKVVSNGGTVLFLSTKKQAKVIVTKYAKDCGMPFVTERWLGGTFTNFNEISKLIRKLVDLKKKKVSGELDKYTKKEKLEFDREIAKLQVMVGGVEELTKIPDVVFVCGVKKEKTAVLEAKKKNIPIVGIADTNVNPDFLTYPIPANDDAVKSIELITSLICQAVLEGQKKKDKAKAEVKEEIKK